MFGDDQVHVVARDRDDAGVPHLADDAGGRAPRGRSWEGDDAQPAAGGLGGAGKIRRPAGGADRRGRCGFEIALAEQVDLQRRIRSEEHTSELQSLLRTSYAVFCLKKKPAIKHLTTNQHKYHKTNTQKTNNTI